MPGIARPGPIRVVWTIADLTQDVELANFLQADDAREHARGLNRFQMVPRFQVERSLIIGNRTV